jgi:phage-related minor tail protein
MADGLTKTLNKALFQRFRDMTGLEDEVERREDELKDQLIQSSDNEKSLGDNINNNTNLHAQGQE